jgi:indolepyruvate ferredoxin oxidoreductase beta subunit
MNAVCAVLGRCSKAMTTSSGIIKISLHALGGQGGSVLTDWITRLAEREGFHAQSTSVPGVAQRTGATVYYIELAPVRADGAVPIFALMPVPGDVDIVLASEVVEAGRAVNRGLVSAQTTVVTSSHRVLAISEKASLVDGRLPTGEIWSKLQQDAAAVYYCDMQAIADRHASVISAAMFGALAASGCLPFSSAAYEATIAESGRAVDANLAAFRAACEACLETRQDKKGGTESSLKNARDQIGQGPVRPFLELARAKCLDYQGIKYQKFYEQRYNRIAEIEKQHYGEQFGCKLSSEVARQLANWMCYEDIIRVSDLKIRSARLQNIRADVKARKDQIITVTEFLHPRVEEVLDILPSWLVRQSWFKSGVAMLLRPFTQSGRRVKTTNFLPFLLLFLLAKLRPLRSFSFKYRNEQQEIEAWLDLIASTLGTDYGRALEIASLPRLRKGYGETFDRGASRYRAIFKVVSNSKGLAAEHIAHLHKTALESDRDEVFWQTIGIEADKRTSVEAL